MGMVLKNVQLYLEVRREMCFYKSHYLYVERSMIDSVFVYRYSQKSERDECWESCLSKNNSLRKVTDTVGF